MHKGVSGYADMKTMYHIEAWYSNHRISRTSLSNPQCWTCYVGPGRKKSPSPNASVPPLTTIASLRRLLTSGPCLSMCCPIIAQKASWAISESRPSAGRSGRIPLTSNRRPFSSDIKFGGRSMPGGTPVVAIDGMEESCCAAGRSGRNSPASNSKPLSSDVTDGERFSAPVEPPVLIPGGTGLLVSPPKVQLLRKCRAVRALRLRSGSEDAASACTDETRLLVLTQRAEINSMADLLMFGFGDVARVRRTSSGIASWC